MDRRVVLFPSYSHVQRYKVERALHGGSCLGIEATTLSLWLEDRWDLYGTEERIISSDQRILIIKHLLNKQEILPKGQNTARLIAQFFLDVWGDPLFVHFCEVFSGGALGLSKQSSVSQEEDSFESNSAKYDQALSEQELALLHLAHDYQRCLYRYNLVEPGSAYRELSKAITPEHIETYGFLDLPSGFVACCEDSQSTLIQHEISCDAVSLADSVNPFILYASGPTALPYLVGKHILSLLQGKKTATAEESVKHGGSVLVASQYPQRVFDGCVRLLQREGYSVGMVSTKRVDQTHFGQAFLGAFSLWKEDDLTQGCAHDYILSPFSDMSRKDAYRFSATIRADRLVRPDDIKKVLNSAGESFGYFEELFETSDASIVLGYFDDKIDRLSGFDKAYKAEQHAAVSAVRSLYDTGRRLGFDPDEFIDLVGSLRISTKAAVSSIDDNSFDDLDVIIAPYSWACDYALAGVDAVIACDLDDQTFPAREEHSALATLKNKIGIQNTENKLNSMRNSFATLQRAARESFSCVACLATDKGEDTYPAFFFDEFLSAFRPEDDENSGFAVPDCLTSTLKTRGEDPFAANFMQDQIEAAVPNQSFESGSVLLNKATLSSRGLDSLLPTNENGTVILSPSAIEEYLACPYRWFVTRKLSPERIDEEFGPREKGVFCHEVFAHFYERFSDLGHDRVNEDNLDEARKTLSTCFDELLDLQSSSHPPRYVPVYHHERFATHQLKSQLIASLDSQAVLFNGFAPRASELVISPEMNREYAGVVINGRVDRVDIDEKSHHFVVLDYKGSIAGHSTGYSPDDAFTIPRKVQTLIYAQVLRSLYPDKRCVGALYYSYSSGSTQKVLAGSYDSSVLDLDGFATRKDKVEMNFLSYLDLVEENLADAIGRLLDGCIEVDPRDNESCRYCPALYCSRRHS